MTMIYLVRHLIWPLSQRVFGQLKHLLSRQTLVRAQTQTLTAERINECRQKRDLILELGLGWGSDLNWGLGIGAQVWIWDSRQSEQLAKSMYQLAIFDVVRQTLDSLLLSWEILSRLANLAVKCHFVQTS